MYKNEIPYDPDALRAVLESEYSSNWRIESIVAGFFFGESVDGKFFDDKGFPRFAANRGGNRLLLIKKEHSTCEQEQYVLKIKSYYSKAGLYALREKDWNF